MSDEPADDVVADAIAAPVVDDPAPAAIAPADAPVEDVSGDPDLATGQAMFAGNDGLVAVRTTSGWLTRDGVLVALLGGE
ncbi:hypothetical protein UFOVP16_31 [uncultured Caudovirales phage]|uniref:Uncharacterized protein n=1 Tax=uncultured Caudovirales phage TaxID=2100421 RepID=A0A6J5KM44_9CAUD|nr:hypothetical protein UFOVP16_31 [uncultured Caudovirales phage]